MKSEVDVTLVRNSIADINCGETFTFEASTDTIWMKLVKEYVNEDGEPLNAVSLDDGTLVFFADCEEIRPIPTKLVNDINDKE